MCDIRTKCVDYNKEYSDILQVPDNGNVLEEFIIRDVAKNLVVTTEVLFWFETVQHVRISRSHRNTLVWKPKENN